MSILSVCIHSVFIPTRTHSWLSTGAYHRYLMSPQARTSFARLLMRAYIWLKTHAYQSTWSGEQCLKSITWHNMLNLHNIWCSILHHMVYGLSCRPRRISRLCMWSFILNGPAMHVYDHFIASINTTQIIFLFKHLDR